VVVLVAVLSALLAGGLAGYLGYRAADRHPNSYSVLPQVGGNPGGPSAANRAPESIAGIAKRVLPSVVSIEVSGGGEEGTGSGFVVRSDGYLLTNNHVVAPAANGGQMRVVFNDESSLAGTIVGRDPTADIAVVKVDKKGMPALTLGRSADIAVGDPVVAIGSPLGLAGTVTSGIVSALDRPVVAGGEDGTDQTVISAIQTDAAINPGNSGGPLVNTAGDVVGIDSAIAQLPGSKSGSIGLGFAIPIDQAKRIADELISTGKSGRTYLGAALDNNYNAGDGAKVTTVQGPAAKAGLQTGDVITKIDSKLVTDSIELVAAIRKRPPGTQVSLTYLRGGQQHTVKVTLEETFN
jgi:putative serine protease PepD